jgi:hypothetical protein
MSAGRAPKKKARAGWGTAMSIFAFVCCVLALAIGVVGGFVWGRNLGRKRQQVENKEDVLRHDAHRENAGHDFSAITEKAMKIVGLANEIALHAKTAQDNVITTSNEPAQDAKMPPEMQSFEAKPKSDAVHE